MLVKELVTQGHERTLDQQVKDRGGCEGSDGEDGNPDEQDSWYGVGCVKLVDVKGHYGEDGNTAQRV